MSLCKGGRWKPRRHGSSPASERLPRSPSPDCRRSSAPPPPRLPSLYRRLRASRPLRGDNKARMGFQSVGRGWRVCVCTRGGAWPSLPRPPRRNQSPGPAPFGARVPGSASADRVHRGAQREESGTPAPAPLQQGLHSRAPNYFSERDCNAVQNHFPPVSLMPVRTHLLCTVK